MPILSAHEISAGFQDTVLFQGVSFSLEKNDRVGLIGANGTGKTTLFKLILGQAEPSEGSISLSSGTRVGCVEQHACSDSSRSAYEEVLTVYSDVIAMEKELEQINARLSQAPDEALLARQETLREALEARDGLIYRSLAQSALRGLGFTPEEISQSVRTLSGGQRTKISLCKLLLSDASLILLDEPTNHLDADSIEWLEEFLRKYRGAALIISHDRYFLDRTTEKTMELTGGRLFFTKGNYSAYQKYKAERLLYESRENEKIEKEIHRIEQMIEQQKRFNQERNYVTIASKEKQIERLKKELHPVVRQQAGMKLRFPVASESGNEVLSVTGLSMSFPGKTLFSDLSFDLRKGDRVFLLGANGCGKTTLFNILTGKLTPDSGTYRFGTGVRMGYFEQTQAALRTAKTVLEEVYDRFPMKTVPELRKILAAFLFRGDDIDKPMNALSGGERAKIALLEIMLRGCNLLLLDEPTNHLDIESREVLEEALAGYEGTVLAVSHDRYFINRLANRLLYFENGKIKSMEGNYDDYLAGRAAPEQAVVRSEKKKPNEYLLKKEAARVSRMRKSEIARLEQTIAGLEEEKTEIQRAIASPENASDYQKITELTNRLSDLSAQQDECTERWLLLCEQEEGSSLIQ